MRRKENYAGVGYCPVCERPIYIDEVTHKLVFSCRVHPCLSKEEYKYYDRENNTDYWREK
jgi:hypothetical protein